jgi:hypothetical protein
MSDYETYHRETWERLRVLFDADDMVGFFRLYAEYLKRSNVVSEPRALLHEMATRMAERLAPIVCFGSALSQEIVEWNAASDEDFHKFED